MAHFRIFIVLIVAIIGYVTLIDSAAVRSEEFGEVLERIALAARPENLRNQRDTDSEIRSRNCYNQPCGWAIYRTSDRIIESYLSNTCECADQKNFRCVRTDDDLSVSAFVYHCRQNTTSEDIEAPENAN